MKTGINAKLYYAIGGQSGAWQALTIARDVNLNTEHDEGDATTKGGGGHKATVATLTDSTIEIEMLWDPKNAGWQALHAAYVAKTPIGLKFVDADVEGKAFQADFGIFSFNSTQPLGDVMITSATAKVTYSDTPPSWTNT